MNQRVNLADPCDVGSWLTRMKQALNGEAEVVAQVRKELHLLQRSREKLTLVVRSPATGKGESLASVIEHVRDNDIVISQPQNGAFTHQLASGENITLTFTSSDGLCSGDVRVIGRIKLPSGGKGLFFGYRLSIPERLRAFERREHRRIKMDGAVAPQVHLATISEKGSGVACVSVSGSIEEISLSGVRVRLDGSAGPINPDSKLTLIADFPSPVGSISHPVHVVRFDHDPQTGLTRLGIKYDVPIPRLAQFLAVFEQRTARRG